MPKIIDRKTFDENERVSPSCVILATALVYTAGVFVLFGMSMYVGQPIVFVVVLSVTVLVMVQLVVAGGYETMIVEKTRREAAKGVSALLWPPVTAAGPTTFSVVERIAAMPSWVTFPSERSQERTPDSEG